jgi:hypothetical protein
VGTRDTKKAERLVTRDVMTILELGDDRVRQLDAELQPERTPSGQRIYRREIVEAYARQRRARRKAS